MYVKFGMSIQKCQEIPNFPYFTRGKNQKDDSIKLDEHSTTLTIITGLPIIMTMIIILARTRHQFG